MLEILFCIETFQVTLLLYSFVKFKSYKSVTAIFYWFTVNAFYTPAVYYVLLNGTSYRSFDTQSLETYLVVGILYILAFQIIEILFSKKNFHIVRLNFAIPKYLCSIFVFFIIFGCIAYVLKYRDGFPLLNYLRTGIMIDFRPDTSGAIPHFFIMGTIMMMVLPMILFYFDETKRLDNKHFIIYTIMFLPFLYLSGNQGIFVYFIIFLWMYKLNYKVNLPIICCGCLSLVMYSIIKSSSGITAISGALRRFFVTQGSGIIARIHLVRNEYIFSGNSISDEVFSIVYGYEGGSMPSFFLGDLIVQFGIPIGLFVSILITFIVLLIGKAIDLNVSLHGTWTFYIILYLIGMSGIHIQFVIRFFMLLAVCFILNGNAMKKKGQICSAHAKTYIKKHHQYNVHIRK